MKVIACYAGGVYTSFLCGTRYCKSFNCASGLASASKGSHPIYVKTSIVINFEHVRPDFMHFSQASSWPLRTRLFLTWLMKSHWTQYCPSNLSDRFDNLANSFQLLGAVADSLLSSSRRLAPSKFGRRTSTGEQHQHLKPQALNIMSLRWPVPFRMKRSTGCINQASFTDHRSPKRPMWGTTNVCFSNVLHATKGAGVICHEYRLGAFDTRKFHADGWTHNWPRGRLWVAGDRHKLTTYILFVALSISKWLTKQWKHDFFQ